MTFALASRLSTRAGWRTACVTAPRFRAQTLRWVRAFASEGEGPLKRTPLHDHHIALGGKMVPFAGYEMPVQYTDSVINSHNHCRNSASLFDVSHMGQVKVCSGENTTDAVNFVESIVAGDVKALRDNQARLSIITNEDGGIIDDTIVTKKEDHVFMVVNGACKDKDLAHMRKCLAAFNTNNGTNVTIDLLEDRALIAFQGPKAAEVLQQHVDVNLADMGFMFTCETSVGPVADCWVSRCGYTGEDGFEISVPAHSATELHSLLNSHESVLPAGLGARDSLRLEAGLCLYGNDIDDTTSPLEAGLMWTISKRRKAEGGFTGHAKIVEKTKTKRRVGLVIVKGAPAREGAEILDFESEEVIGNITSGTVSPVTKQKLSMGYVKFGSHKKGTQVKIRVRGKVGEAEIAPMPFVPTNYYTGGV